MTFSSFEAFVESVVLPRRAANPSDVRLDGELSGGNFGVSGVFRHDGREWKVHEDSHYEPLLIAYEAAKRDGVSPFVEVPTRRSTSLNLRNELRERQNTRFKHLYIYAN